MKGCPSALRTLCGRAALCVQRGRHSPQWHLGAAHGQAEWHTAVPMFATGHLASPGGDGAQHVWLMTALFCLAGFTAQAYMPAFWTLPTTLLGKSAAATAVGLICLGNLGGVAGPWLFGYLKTVTGSYDAGLLGPGRVYATGRRARHADPNRPHSQKRVAQ